jgi:hypothetical protein
VISMTLSEDQEDEPSHASHLLMLTYQSTVVTICTTSFNIKKHCSLTTESIYMFYMIIRIRSDFLP